MATGSTVLIVDDHVTLAKGFAQVLTGAGYAVHTAFIASDGLALACEHRPDVIVLDIGMPFVNGVGLLYRLRAMPEHAQTPVLIVTGATVTDETRADLLRLGARLRCKPIGATELLDEVHDLLSGGGARRDPRPGIGRQRWRRPDAGWIH
jgi:DNA-binding response OmpR family regulator